MIPGIMGHYHYRIVGVDLESDAPLHGLEWRTRPTPHPWRLVKREGRFPFPVRGGDRRFRWRPTAGGGWRLVWPGEGVFHISPTTRCVDYHLASTVADDAFLDMLIGPVASYLMLLDGTYPLHGSAVRLDDRAVCFLGSSGAGKSTTAAALLFQGWSLIVDDVLAVGWRRNAPYALPGTPQIRLWPASGKRFVDNYFTLPKVVAGSSKRLLDTRLRGGGIVRTPVPLRACYELRRAGWRRQPVIEPIAGREAFVTLMRHLYNTAQLTSDAMRRQFDELGRLADRIPVRRLYVPRGEGGLNRLPAMILADLDRIGA